MSRWIRGLLRDRTGLAAVEFALLAPVLVSLWLGMTEFANMHLAARKANIAAQSVADLVAQQRTVTTTELDDMLEAARQIMAPFPPEFLTVQILSVFRDDDDALVTEWQYGTGGAAPAETESLVGTGDSVIVVRLTYRYQPILDTVIGVRTLSENAFARPRLQAKVVLDQS